MEWGLLIPIVAIAGGPIAWVATTWIRARHGYPIETEKGELLTRDGRLGETRERELLAAENERLTGQVGRPGGADRGARADRDRSGRAHRARDRGAALMDDGAIWILVPLAGVMIPIVAILSNLVFRPWLKLKERELELRAEHTAEKAAQYAAHTERLEQRVRVLERIATDRGADVAAQIDLLRDDRLN